MRPILAILLAVTLALAGCGSGSDLADVQVGGADTAPTLTFDTPFAVKATTRTILRQGEGEPLQKGQKALVNYLGVNGRTGEVFDSSFDTQPTEFPLEDGKLVPGFISGLVGAPVGSRVLIAMPPEDGYPEGTPDGTITAGDSLIFLVDVISARQVLDHASGEDVPQQPGNPQVTVGEDGVPSVTVPAGPPPAQPVIQTLIQGDGPKVQAGQQVVVQFLSVRWADGTVVDSSWAQGSPGMLSVATGALVPALDAALLDENVGSRVLVVTNVTGGVPGEDATASPAPTGEPAPAATEEAFIFVIDILDVA